MWANGEWINELATGSANENISYSLVSGNTYYLAVAPYSSAVSNYSLSVDLPEVDTPPAHGFTIDLTYTGDQAYAQYFSAAKAVWERVITGDVADIAGVDDLAISASVAYIDGEYNTLGQAGPTACRLGSYIPYRGEMEFDSADMAMMEADGTLTAVITHEMGHVLGFGTVWSDLGLNSTVGRYTGTHALTEYRALSGNSSASYVPLETTGGSGTANVHWSESVFNTELMTGWSENSGAMPLSRLTIAAIEDLGYVVDYSAADSYALLLGLAGINSANTENYGII